MASRNFEFSEKFNETQDAIDFNDISLWSCERVCRWLKDINLSQYVDNFRSKAIDGYDLVLLNMDVLQNELKVTSFHDCNSIIKQVRATVLNQCRF